MRLETIRKSTVVRNCLSKHNCQVIKENNLPEGISCLINGDYKVGEMMTNDKRVPLISATGSIRMGKIVAQTVEVVWEDHYW
jgi:acyl-CoA reductase-like NAD-dependent aldehyde dehydrogenase